ncbi:S41 family peptidase [Stackebrandtia soli]|uniref:S41 family peptidase n=1 Tax=Stackebrandtia soli TaxID=1892856 RepID=UPI0039ED6804
MDTSTIVTTAAELLTRHYVFPERAAEMASTIRRSLTDGAYEGLSDEELCEALTSDLHSVHSDLHLRLRWHAEARERVEDDDAHAERQFAAWRQVLRTHGQGVDKVQVLPGNIGLVALNMVGEPKSGGDAYAAAMRIVADTECLILDLRANGGGSTDGAALWCSYFLGAEPVHLNDIHLDGDPTPRQMWSLSHLAGPRYLDRPVYVLLSGRTFSGAEDIAYTLAAHGRATTVGETTRGGAHPTSTYWIDTHIDIRVPNGRTVSPITGTNWEGVGVTPDIACGAPEALDMAYRRCLDHVLGANPDEPLLTEARTARVNLDA